MENLFNIMATKNKAGEFTLNNIQMKHYLNLLGLDLSAGTDKFLVKLDYTLMETYDIVDKMILNRSFDQTVHLSNVQEKLKTKFDSETVELIMRYVKKKANNRTKINVKELDKILSTFTDT